MSVVTTPNIILHGLFGGKMAFIGIFNLGLGGVGGRNIFGIQIGLFFTREFS